MIAEKQVILISETFDGYGSGCCCISIFTLAVVKYSWMLQDKASALSIHAVNALMLANVYSNDR